MRINTLKYSIAKILRELQLSDGEISLAQSATIALVIQASSAALTYIVQVFFARWMGEYDYGAYAYSFAWAYLLAALSGLGLTTGVLKFIPHVILKKDWARLKGVIYRSRQLTFAAGVILAIIGTITILLLPSDKVNITTLLLGMWLVPFLALVNLQTEIIRASKHIALAYLPPMIFQPILSVGFSFFILQTMGTLTSLSTMSAVLLAILIALASQFWSIRYVLPDDIKLTAPIYETVEWLRVSFPLLIIVGFQFIFGKTDILMVGMLIGQKQAGIYNIASKTASLVIIILTALNAIVAPMIATYYAKGDLVSLQRLISIAMRWITWLSLFISLGLILFGKLILGLFGPVFVQGYWALVILVAGQLINACAGPVGYLMNLTGNQILSARVIGLSTLVNFILNAILIPLWGIYGAALATTVSIALMNIWLCKLVKKHIGISTQFIGA